LLNRSVLAVAALVCTHVAWGAAITIDGTFSDWGDIKPISVGVLSVGSSPNPAGNTLQAVWMTSVRKNLYLSIQCAGPIQGSQWGPTCIAIDSDCDETTGFPAPPLGVDFFVQPSGQLDGRVAIHRRIDGANDEAWSRWHPPVTIARGCAIGRGEQSNRIEMKIPFPTIGVSESETAALRFRICDGAPLLNSAAGSWAPGCRLAYFSFGADPGRMDEANNLCLNGGFENLMEAAASRLPQGWAAMGHGTAGRVEATDQAFTGKHALSLAARSGGAVGANSTPIEAARGLVHFRYTIPASSASGGNLALFVIALSGKQGHEVRRQAWSPPKEHVADGEWHEALVEFDFSSLRAGWCLIAPRINEGTAAVGNGEWLLDDVEVYAVHAGARVHIAHVWCSDPAARVRQPIRFSAWVENIGDSEAHSVTVDLQCPPGVRVREPTQTIGTLEPDSFERVDWEIRGEKPGRFTLDAGVSFRKSTSGKVGNRSGSAGYKLLVIDPNAKLTRQALCTDGQGYWRILERPKTLQDGNTAAMVPVRHKNSSEIQRNTYGICGHLPRSKDYEAPFAPVHLIDGDPETCWSSQQNSSTYPGIAPWVEIDLGAATTVSQVNLIPYWRNTDFPLGFCVRTSLDAKRWGDVHRVRRHVFADIGPKRGDKIAQVFPLPKSIKARFVRIEFERLPLSGGNYAEVSQGYKARLSGIELIDATGRNVALAELGASVRAIDYFTGWHNTAKAVNEAFPRILDIGLKWMRVGQWGDQTEWAAVEREKGRFAMDPVTDAGIQFLLDNGVDILFGLDYGNALHEPREKPFMDIGPIYREGHPFYMNGGPTTEAGRQAFVRYVDYVVRKYGDRIKWWELWNEQNGWYPGHEPELYGKLLHAVAKRIKSIDPKLKMMFGGTAAPAPLTTEIALREGAAPYLDACAFHPYGIDKPEGGMGTMEFYQGRNLSQSREQTGWNRLEKILEGVRKPFAQHGNPNVEVWINEWGTNVAGLDFTYNPGIGEYGCAKYLMRFYIYGGWLHVPTAWWALHNLNRSQDWGILEQADYGFRPMSYALQNVCSVVSDVEPVRELDYRYEGAAADPKVIRYERDGKEETLVLVWAADLFTDEVRAYPSRLGFALGRRPETVTITDLYWGVSQAATWDFQDGRVILDRLIVRDYPLVIACE